MKQDSLLAGLIFLGTAIYLIQRRVGHMLVWVLLTYLFATEIGGLSDTVSVIAGIVVIFLICSITKSVWEGFEDGKKEGESDGWFQARTCSSEDG
jgi:thiol:disulfide interchange protein